ncbi:unnamed protein product [Schistosoma turkestanicum]|nr:unnamed protein product [Schistosoma turkestanicum]
MRCNKTISIKFIKLLDCFSKKSLNEFILKVSRFPEITSLPSFDYNTPVHFIDHPFTCQKNNFRLSFKLANNSVNNKINYSAFDVLKFPTSESQLTDHKKFVFSSNDTLQYHSKTELFLQTPITYSNHTYIIKEVTIDWKEYKFLFVSAIFAFLTLIGIQIILCSFWLPNSIVNKFSKYFKKCKRKRTHEFQLNHIGYKYEIKSLNVDNGISSMPKINSSNECSIVTNPHQCTCSAEPIVTHTH